MIRRANKLIVSLALVAIVSYIFYLNPGPISVNYGPNATISAPTAIILLTTFAAGVLFASIFAFFFAVKSYWTQRQLQERVKRRDAAYQGVLRARSSLAAEDWEKAESEWRAILNKDPDDIIARVELSRSLEGNGELGEALKAIDQARAIAPNNLEVLFRATELNLALNNRTAAIDNLALILYDRPNQKAARLARDLSEQLERTQDALQYHKTLEKLGEPIQDSENVVARLRLKELNKEFADDPAELKNGLKKFIKLHPNSTAGLLQLARLEAIDGNTEEGAKLLLKGSKISGDAALWIEAAALWLSKNNPDRAISAAKTGNEQLQGLNRINSELELTKFYLGLGMTQEAKRTLDGVLPLANTLGVTIPESTSRAILVLKGRCFNALADYRESAKIWTELSEGKLDIKQLQQNAKVKELVVSAPPPILSTP